MEKYHDYLFSDECIIEKLLSEDKLYFENGVELTKEEYLNLKENKKLPLKEKGFSKFYEEMNEWRRDNISENPLSSAERQSKKEDLKEFSDVTKEFLKIHGNNYATIMQDVDYKKIKGTDKEIPVFNNEVKFQIEELKKERVNAKSIYNNGSLKSGIYFTEETTDGAVKVGNSYIIIDSTSSEEALLAYELHKLDNKRMDDFKSGKIAKAGMTDKFRDVFSELEAQEAYDFLLLNSYVGFSDEYYEAIKPKEGESFINKLEAAKDGENDYIIEEIVNDINEYSGIINNILKANRVLNRPSEVNFENMSSAEIQTVIKFQERLQAEYAKAYAFIKAKDITEEVEVISEKGFNEAFSNHVRALTTSAPKETLEETKIDIERDTNVAFTEQFKIVRQHVTSKDEIDLTSLLSFVNSGKTAIPTKGKKVFTKSQEYYEDLSAKDLKIELQAELLQYSYTKLMPYFKKSEAVGYGDALSELRENRVSPAEFLNNYENGRYGYLSITPNFSFQDERTINKRFQNNKENHTPQIRVFEESTTIYDVRNNSLEQLQAKGKISKFANLDYIKKYNIDLVQLYETGIDEAKNIL
jgi:hypothetical protein